jgi:hypothetical protein
LTDLGIARCLWFVGNTAYLEAVLTRRLVLANLKLNVTNILD